jgi:hypothetical protein
VERRFAVVLVNEELPVVPCSAPGGSKVGGTTKVFDLSSPVDEGFFVGRERDAPRQP